MKNITTGHWIFAALFAMGFIAFLVWSYRKDNPMHKIHYRGSFIFTLIFIVVFFLIFVFKRLI